LTPFWRRSEGYEQPFEVGGFYQPSGRRHHQRLAAGRNGEEMVTDIVNADLG
jgi:hypothetical protein